MQTNMLLKSVNIARYAFTLLRCKAKYGKRVFIGKTGSIIEIPKLSVKGHGAIHISDHCGMEYCEIVAIDGVVTIGDHTFLGANDSIVCRGRVSIGSHCSIAPNITIYDHNHNFGANGIEKGYRIKDVQIGNNVWIGVGAIILAGTDIGDNCVIGAGTVVHGYIPPNSLVTSTRELSITRLGERNGKSSDNNPRIQC